MPGMLYHIAFAEDVFRHLYGRTEEQRIDFISGNLIPDLSAADKKISHYQTKSLSSELNVPNLDLAKKDLYDKSNFLKLGIYAHLYFDYYFIEEYLSKEFDIQEKVVISNRTGKVWSTDTFFAIPENGGVLYNGYRQINHLMIKDKHVNLKEIEKIPNDLKMTGIEVFDNRRQKSWREELNGYLSKKAVYTGEPILYMALLDKISEIETKFITEELY